MTISVIIPVYNAAQYVEQAVESALSQTETGEVILVEDASPDNSLQICKKLAQTYDKVRLLRHPEGKNRGAAASRNLAIKNTSFDYIAFLDADDYYLPGCFKLAQELLDSNPDIDGVYEAVGTHFEDENLKDNWFWRNEDREQMTTMKRKVAPEQLFEYLISGEIGYFHIDGMLVRQPSLLKIGCFDEHIDLVEDSVIYVKMAAMCKLVPGDLTQPLRMRRVHALNRISASKEKFNYHDIKKWQFLFNWAKNAQLQPQNIDLLFTKYFEACWRYLKMSIMRDKKVFNMVKLLKIITIEQPSIVTRPLMWFDSSQKLLQSKLNRSCAQNT